MSTFKTVTEIVSKLITLESPMHYSEVIKRLNEAVNKQHSASFPNRIKEAKSKQEIENVVNDITGETNDFLYFTEVNHHLWLNIYHNVNDTPATISYTIGNPLIAETILRQDLCAALHIPPRVLIQEQADRSGTKITYQIPSSIMVLPGSNDESELRIAVELLDKKLESMLCRVLGLEE